jgi:poly(3-hydroxybutyrate) depolymerase
MVRGLGSFLSCALVLTGAHAHAQVPDGDPTDLPILSAEVPRGNGEAVEVAGPHPAPKVVDGDISDWVGRPSLFGGTALFSAGELIYQDHIFDAHGPDDGRDAQRLEATGPLRDAIDESYRIEALAQADPAGQVGVPAPDALHTDDTYGDAVEHQDAADLAEVRLAADDTTLYLLVRTTTMTSDGTTLLLLADTQEDPQTYEVPFNSGIHTERADIAASISALGVKVADLASGQISDATGSSVAVNPEGFTNAIEAAIPLDAFGGQIPALALASGTGDGSGGFSALDIEVGNDEPHANLANVAFRVAEPIREWFEFEQALSLHAGTIDPFFYEVDAEALASGVSQRWEVGAGYHDRIFLSTMEPQILLEQARDGLFQHYGVYLPSTYIGEPVPLQWWLHWRGGRAHTGAAVVPKVFKQFGEDRGSIVVSPSGRGTSTWYVGRGHIDVQEVWKDVFDTFAIDRYHVYVTGHSMGGWGSYLLPLLYPDRFTAAAPVAGPVTQGAWTGLDFPGCDDLESGGSTPCYIEANDSRPRDQHTRKLLENALHVPYAILHGTKDELVPYSGVARQAERLLELGYRHRFYTYPGYEHFSHPLMDQWAEAARFLHTFTRNPNPARVVYKRDMLFEIATEEVQSGGADLDFNFDSAYWMSRLEPQDEAGGVAAFDGRSLAIPEEPQVTVPDSGPPVAPGQTGPYLITGLQWLDDPTGSADEPRNAFEFELSGAKSVQLDLERMEIDTARTIEGTASSDEDMELRLDGGWKAPPRVTVDDQEIKVSLSKGILTIPLPAGDHSLVIEPRGGPKLCPVASPPGCQS